MSNNSLTPVEPKRSKLALKSRRAHEKPAYETPADEDFHDFGFTPPLSPMFLPKTTRSRALPSAFASLLVDDRLTSYDSEGKGTHKHKGERREDIKHIDASGTVSALSDLAETPKHRPQSSSPASPKRFAFDVPSPDDIVLNARRGTSLAQ